MRDPIPKAKRNRVFIKQILDMDWEPKQIHGIRNHRILENLGLPGNLLELIRDGRLEQAIDEGYERLDWINKMMDLWEENNPSLAPLTPWYEAREAWKAAGRPKPEWYSVITWENRRAITKAITPEEIERQITHERVKPYRIQRRKPIDEGGRPQSYGKTGVRRAHK